MSLNLPRFRDDLTTSEQQSASGTVLVVKNPITGAFFRLGEVERYIVDQCDGRTPRDAIQRRVEEAFGGTLHEGGLERFLTHLERAGLLASESTETSRREPRRSRVKGSWLYLRFQLCNPDRLLGRLVRPTRLLFTGPFVAISAMSVLLAAAIAASNWGDVRADFPRVYEPSALPLILVTIFLVASAHELAHGLTCRRFGGHVPEMGLMLLYFQPALYCNVSDAWLFPEKSKRFWVALAGPAFELFLWSLATLAWRATEPETLVNTVGYVVMTTSGIKTLFNFNPLLKLDGYYLLSDYLEIPNLRRRAFRYIGDSIRRLFGSVAPGSPTQSPRERRIFLGYGLVASVYSFTLLGVAVVKLGGFLAESHRPVAIAGAFGWVGTKAWRRLRRFFRRSGQDDATEGDDDATEGDDDAVTGDAPPARAHRTVRWKWRVGLVAAAALPILFLGRLELKVDGQVSVLPLENADSRAAVEGIVEEVLVEEGDRVHAGDVIARLGDRELQARRRMVEAQIEQTQARVKLLEAGPTKDEIDVAQAAKARAEDHVAYAERRLATNRELAQQGLAPRSEMDVAEEQLVTARHDLAEARGKLRVLQNGSRPEDIEAARADLRRLEAERQLVTEQLGLLNVTSPITGIVATPRAELHEMRQRLVSRGDLIAKVYDYGTVLAQIAVSEREIADVRVGQAVLTKVRAYPDETFRGTVRAIATRIDDPAAASGTGPSGASPSRRASQPPQTILVTTRIDNRGLLLKDGMTGHAKISCGKRRIAELIARRLARTLKVEFWSWT